MECDGLGALMASDEPKGSFESFNRFSAITTLLFEDKRFTEPIFLKIMSF
jgi:hypothetical protein